MLASMKLKDLTAVLHRADEVDFKKKYQTWRRSGSIRLTQRISIKTGKCTLRTDA